MHPDQLSVRLGRVCLRLVNWFCHAALFGTAADLNQIQIGMDKAKVLTVLGQPMTHSADAAADEERLTYKRMAYALGWSPTLYDVVLEHGKVVRFGAQP